MFPSVQNNVHEIIPIITQELELLEEKITKYFPTFNIQKYNWIHNPFSTFNTLIYKYRGSKIVPRKTVFAVLYTFIRRKQHVCDAFLNI